MWVVKMENGRGYVEWFSTLSVRRQSSSRLEARQFTSEHEAMQAAAFFERDASCFSGIYWDNGQGQWTLKATVMPLNCLMDTKFAAWAARPEVQAAARAYIVQQVDGAEMLLQQLERPVIGGRIMNFNLIGPINELFYKAQKRLDLNATGFERAQLNALATKEEPHWRVVYPVFAYSLGFRDSGDVAGQCDAQG